MKNQLSLCKQKRNKEFLCTKMDKTFPHRRHLIVDSQGNHSFTGFDGDASHAMHRGSGC